MRKKIAVLFFGCVMPFSVNAGPISSAQPISIGLMNILDFLLSIVGVVAIIGLVVAGALYFFAVGDMRRIAVAKKILFSSITGILIALGALVLVRAITSFLS